MISKKPTPPVFGFHCGPGGNHNGLTADFMDPLSRAGIPFILKSADSYGQLYEAANIADRDNVDHVLIYRMSTAGQSDGFDYDVPRYDMEAEAAAALHWSRIVGKIPPEFNRDRVWIEPINEVDKERSDWLGYFALEIANLANADGFRVTLFGFASGEPRSVEFGDSVSDWETPGMLNYLDYCGRNPDRAAVALHEYNTEVQDPTAPPVYPYNYGRFQALFYACDKHGIPRPTVHFTEWGWNLAFCPDWETAQNHIYNAALLYGRFPTIQGAAIWNLGSYQGTGVENSTQKLIAPLAQFMASTTTETPLGPAPLDPDYFPPVGPVEPPDNGDPRLGDARIPYDRKYYRVNSSATLSEFLAVAALAYQTRSTVGFSNDDAGIGVGLKNKIVYEVGGEFDPDVIDQWYRDNYGVTAVTHSDYPEEAPDQPDPPDPPIVPPPIPPPSGGDWVYNGPPVQYTPAIHAPGSDWMWNNSELRGMLDFLGLPVKFMSNGSNRDFFGQYGANKWHIVRVFYQPDGSQKTAVQVWAEIGSDLLQWLRIGARRFELFNEPNLPGEGWGTMWTNGRELGIFLAEFAQIFKNEAAIQGLAEPLCYYPGLSPQFGGQYPITDAALAECGHVMDGLAVHAYTGITDNVGAAVADIVEQVREFGRRYAQTLPVIVSECSVNRGGPVPDIYSHKAAVYRGIDAALANVPGVEAAIWFISHWDPPAEQADHLESWLFTNLPALYKYGAG